MDVNYKDNWNKFLYQQVELIIENIDTDESGSLWDEMFEVISNVMTTYEVIVPVRSFPITFIHTPQTELLKCKVDKKLEYLYEKNKLCSEQKTENWHKQRYKTISASVAWQALGSQCSKNSLIYNKCKPLDIEKTKHMSINTALHWGQKFEPVSQMYYEYTFNAKISEFGCIPHAKYDFLGASPDGIVSNRENDRYGRMLEIKNRYGSSTIINGIPKKQYWVQMQMQMECCNMDECDFLECRFTLYDSEEEFLMDGTFQQNKQGQPKGIIMCFYGSSKPIYEYSPYQCTADEYELWQEQMMEKHKNISWIQNEFWYLEEVSCVLVLRNPICGSKASFMNLKKYGRLL